MHKQPLHICLVAPSIYPIFTGDRTVQFAGGAEVQQSFIARGLQAQGYRVTLLTDDYGQPADTQIDGIRIIKIITAKRQIPLVRNVHPRLTSVWAAMKKANADIYYQRCAGANTAMSGLFARRYKRLFIYAGAHDFDFERDQTRKLFRGRGGFRSRQLFYLGLRLADAIITQHAGQAEACRRWYGRDSSIIPNCYSPPLGASSSSDGVILWVAILRAWKRPELFVELARSLPHLRFRMIGGPASGEEELFHRIKADAEKLPNLEFLGFVPYADVEKHFDETRLFVNTSDAEGFPNTFLQAWARGIPTISFVDCGATENGRPIGRVVRDINDMKDVTRVLSADAVQWNMEGARARRYYETHHSVRQVIGRYRPIIDGLFESSGRGHGVS